jgi:hypothetical protein
MNNVSNKAIAVPMDTTKQCGKSLKLKQTFWLNKGNDKNDFYIYY